ncbi:unnamed protein product, partial [Discosporangium mesarthrocarpum]
QEAEKVLHYLETIGPAALIGQLLSALASLSEVLLREAETDAAELPCVQEAFLGVRKAVSAASEGLAEASSSDGGVLLMDNRVAHPISQGTLMACDTLCGVVDKAEALLCCATSLLHKLPQEYDLVNRLASLSFPGSSKHFPSLALAPAPAPVSANLPRQRRRLASLLLFSEDTEPTHHHSAREGATGAATAGVLAIPSALEHTQQSILSDGEGLDRVRDIDGPKTGPVLGSASKLVANPPPSPSPDPKDAGAVERREEDRPTEASGDCSTIGGVMVDASGG